MTVKKKLFEQFKMKDLGELKYYLGLEISRDRNRRKLQISQQKYIDDLLAKFNIENCNTVKTPRDNNVTLTPIQDGENKADVKRYQSIIGSLMLN